jgi:hypothetical protein
VVSVYAQLPYFGFECLSGSAQLNGGAAWPSNHDLRLWRKIAYFIEEYRSTVSRFETTQPTLSGPSKGTFFVAEQVRKQSATAKSAHNSLE